MMLTVYIKGNLYLYPLKTSLCIFFLLNLFFKMLAQNHLLPNAFWEHTPSLMDNRTIYLMHLCPTVSGSGIALSHVQIFAIPWTTAHQASPSFTIPQSLLKLMSIGLVMPSHHLILCCLLLLLPSIFPSIRLFSHESALHIRWPKYWNFSFSISPSNKYSLLFSLGSTDLILQSKGLSRVFCNTMVQKQQFFHAHLSLWSTLISIHNYWKNHNFY